VRELVRQFLDSMINEEATAALGRGRYERGAAAGYRNGTRKRRLLGSFGPVEIAVPRARLTAADGATREWRSGAAALRPDDPACRGADCLGLSLRHQHPAGDAALGLFAAISFAATNRLRHCGAEPSIRKFPA
jgi:hypothetical protein